MNDNLNEAEKPEKVIDATWSVSLDTECPRCEEFVNLLDYVDFWDGRELEVGETRSERSNNLEVVCPKCNHEFKVCCES